MDDRVPVPEPGDGGAEGRPIDRSPSADQAFAVVVLESDLPLMVVSQRTSRGWRVIDERDRFTRPDPGVTGPLARSVVLPQGGATRRVDLVRGRLDPSVERAVFEDGGRRFSVSVENGLYWCIRWGTTEEGTSQLTFVGPETEESGPAIPLDDHTWEETPRPDGAPGLAVVLGWQLVRVEGSALRLAFEVTRHMGDVSVRVTESASRVLVGVHASWLPPVGDWFEEHLRVERTVRLERPLGSRELAAERPTWPPEAPTG